MTPLFPIIPRARDAAGDPEIMSHFTSSRRLNVVPASSKLPQSVVSTCDVGYCSVGQGPLVQRYSFSLPAGSFNTGYPAGIGVVGVMPAFLRKKKKHIYIRQIEDFTKLIYIYIYIFASCCVILRPCGCVCTSYS